MIIGFAAATGAFAETGHGGGYAWRDGKDAPPYDWFDTSDGTLITTWVYGADDGYATINTPFDIYFFGTLYPAGSDLYVGTNGLMGFTMVGIREYYNRDIPNPSDPNNYIGIFWDDLNGGYDGAECRYMTAGSAPNRFLVITYKPWYRDEYYADPLSFQVFFYENDGTFDNTIMMQYEDVVCGSALYDYGGSATVGLENAEGTDGCKYLYKSPDLRNELVVEYLDIKPQPFNLLTPEDGAIIDVFASGGRVSVYVDFAWEESTTYGPGVITYEYIVDDDADFGSPEYDLTGLTDETCSICFNVTDTVTYFWRVIAAESEYGKARQCYNDFTFTFIYGNAEVTPASLGDVKAGFHE